MSEEVRDEVGDKVRDEVPDEAPAQPPVPFAAEPSTPSRLEAFVTGGAYGVLAVGGAVIGLAGSFYQDYSIGPIPVVAILFVLLNLGGFWLAGWAMGTRLGAVVPAVGWLLVVIFLSSTRPEGDLVISGTMAGYVFILGGAVADVIAIARTSPTHNWILPQGGPGSSR